MSISDLVRECRRINPKDRQAWLQERIGPKIDRGNPSFAAVLDCRAQLVTALAREHLWPPNWQEDDGA